MSAPLMSLLLLILLFQHFKFHDKASVNTHAVKSSEKFHRQRCKR